MHAGTWETETKGLLDPRSSRSSEQHTETPFLKKKRKKEKVFLKF
jgi:hypothetical protein